MQAAMSAGGDYWKSWTNKVCLVGKLEGNQKFEKCLSQDKARRRSRSYQQTKSASFQLQPPVLVDSVEVRHKHSKTSGSGTSSAKNVNVEIFSPDLPTDCKGQWSPWSNCSDAGKKTRTFKVQRAAAKGGKACTNEADAKEEESCPVACKGEWSSWSACQNGKKTRTYTVKRAALNGGKACAASNGQRGEQTCSISSGSCIGKYSGSYYMNRCKNRISESSCKRAWYCKWSSGSASSSGKQCKSIYSNYLSYKTQCENRTNKSSCTRIWHCRWQ